MAGRNDAIGTGSIVLSVNADRVVGGLVRVGRTVEGWASGLKSRMGGGGILDALTPSGMAARVGAVTGTVLGVGAAIQNVHDIAKQGAIADAMGLTSEQFTGMAAVAKSVGEDTREFTESIVTMGKMVSDGVKGTSKEAADLFGAINIGAEKFVGLRADQQFFKMMGAIKAVQDPLQRTRAIMLAFGEDGGKWLLPLLSKSESELLAFAKANAIAGEKMEQARAASLRLLEAQAKFRMMWNNITIAAAPVFEFLATEISHTIESFSKLETNAVEPLEKIIRMTASLADAFKAVSGTVMQLQGTMLKNFESLVRMWSIVKGAQMGGAPGAGLAAAGAELLLGKLKKDGTTAALNLAGETLSAIGKKAVEDAGKSVKRADEFLKGLKTRQAGKGGSWLDPIFNMKVPAPPEAYKAPTKFAEAFLSQSKEAYSLEMKHRFGLSDKEKNHPKQAVDELKKSNKKLDEIKGKLNNANQLNIRVM